MHRKPLTLLAYLAVVPASLLLAFAGPAPAAILSLDVFPGFNGHCRIPSWAPLTVELANRGPGVTGRLEVVVTSGSEYLRDVHSRVYRRDIELPPDSRKRYPFTIRIDTFAHPLAVRLWEADRLLASTSVNLRPRYTPNPLCLVVARRTSPDFLAALPAGRFPVTGRADHLPEDWFGYDGVGLIVMGADAMGRLSARQIQALAQWVRQGGCLVSAGDANYGALEDRRLRPLLPLRVVGHTALTAVTSLEPFCGRSLTQREPFLVLNARLEGSRTLVDENGIPIVAARNVGFGKVIFLAFDIHSPPFSRWPARTAFWETIGEGVPAGGSTDQSLDPQTVLPTMLALMRGRFPDVRLAFALLAGYAGLLWLGFRHPGGRRVNPRRVGRYLLPAIVLFSAAVGLLMGYPQSHRAASCNVFTHLKISAGNPVAFGRQILGLYTLRPMAFDLAFGDRSVPVTHLLYAGAGRKIPAPYLTRQEDAGQRISVQAPGWSHSFLSVAAEVAFPSTARGTDDRGAIQLQVANQTPYGIGGCWVYYGDRLFRLEFDLPPHTSRTARLERPGAQRGGNPGRPGVRGGCRRLVPIERLGLCAGHAAGAGPAGAPSGALPLQGPAGCFVPARLDRSRPPGCGLWAPPPTRGRADPRRVGGAGGATGMKWEFLTDTSARSLAPFFEERTLAAVFNGVLLSGGLTLLLWPRQALSVYITRQQGPGIAFQAFTAALLISAYLSLRCGRGEMLPEDPFRDFRPEASTFEKERAFVSYTLVGFLLHTLFLVAAQFPILLVAGALAGLSPAIWAAGVAVVFSACLLCRLFAFVTYLWGGRWSVSGYLATRAFGLLFLLGTAAFWPTISPLRLLHTLNAAAGGHETESFKLYLAGVGSLIVMLIACNHLLIARRLTRERKT